MGARQPFTSASSTPLVVRSSRTESSAARPLSTSASSILKRVFPAHSNPAGLCAARAARPRSPAWPGTFGRFGRTRVVKLLLAIALACLPTACGSSGANKLVGADVVMKKASPLLVKGKMVDPGTTFRIYRVKGARGSWVFLENRSISGWTKADEVVPFDLAIDYFTREIKVKPNPWSFKKRGLIWHTKQEFDKAIADFSESIRLNPADPSAHANRGVAWHAKKQYDKAIADFSEAIQLDPKSFYVHFLRGITSSAMRQYGKALADYDDSITFAPSFAEPYNFRAWLLATCPDETYRDGPRAVESARRACELTVWRESQPIATLAAAAAEAGDFDAAVQWQTKATELAPQNKKADYRARLELFREKKPYREQAPDS
jgi:Flp pilus assembly protein TadD